MSTINILGPVGYNPTGPYDPTRTYQKLDVVYYQGSSYVAISDSIGQLPTNTNYWNCIATGALKKFTYNSVAEMKLDNALENGVYAFTGGYYEPNDGGAATYKITSEESETEYQEELENGLYATLVTGEYVNAKQYGLKNDGSDNTTMAIELFKNNKIYFDNGTYIFNNISIDHDIEIKGNNATLKSSRVSNTNNRYNTLFTFSNNIDVDIKNIIFEGYTNVESQTGTLTAANSLINVIGCNSIKVENCKFINFDNSYASSTPSLFTSRKAALFTIHDTLKTIFINNIFNNLKGEELIYCIDNELDRTDINMDFIGNTIKDIKTSCIDFIGNILNLKNNYYNFNYTGSCLNIYALYLFIENEEVNGSFDNVYDNCEEVYFRGVSVYAKNVINNANVTNALFHLSADTCVIDNLINNNDQTMNCVRNYFGTNNSNIHKDCTNSIISKTFTKILNSYLVAKHCVTSFNTNATDYNLLIQNCELKSSLASNTWMIATAPFELTLVDNIIHLCVTAGSGAPTVIYNRSDNVIKLIKATNNKIINDTESQQRFIVGTLPDFISFIGNTTNKSNSIIAADLTNVKAYSNYNYNES